MMTKEEVAAIVAYCDEKKISYKERLQELGIPAWSFYDAKRKYARESNGGEFLQLLPGGAFVPNPIKAGRSGKTSKASQSGGLLSIELRTPNGTMMRIQGEMSGRMLQELILASSGHVQP